MPHLGCFFGKKRPKNPKKPSKGQKEKAKCSGSAKIAKAYVQRDKESEKHGTDANVYCTKRSIPKLSVSA